MELVKLLCSVCTSDLEEDLFPTRMLREEGGYVVDLSMDDDPAVALRVVLGHVFCGEYWHVLSVIKMEGCKEMDKDTLGSAKLGENSSTAVQLSASRSWSCWVPFRRDASRAILI